MWGDEYLVVLGGPAFTAHLEHVLGAGEDQPDLPGVVVLVTEIDVLSLGGPLPVLRYHRNWIKN